MSILERPALAQVGRSVPRRDANEKLRGAAQARYFSNPPIDRQAERVDRPVEGAHVGIERLANTEQLFVLLPQFGTTSRGLKLKRAPQLFNDLSFACFGAVRFEAEIRETPLAESPVHDLQGCHLRADEEDLLPAPEGISD